MQTIIEETEAPQIMDAIPTLNNHNHNHNHDHQDTIINHNQTNQDILFQPRNNSDDQLPISWGDVFTACCCHRGASSQGIKIILYFIAIILCLCLFILGNELFRNGIMVLSGCGTGKLLTNDQNPIVSLMVGILATLCMQSSLISISIISALCASNALTVQDGIFMVMGTSIGATITTAIVSLSFIQNQQQRGRTTAAASLHGLFNIFTVAILFPLEIATSSLFNLSQMLVKGASTKKSSAPLWESPIQKLVSPLSDFIIIPNQQTITILASSTSTSCQDFYPINCTKEEIHPHKAKFCAGTSLIQCSKATGQCPFYFQQDATQHDDQLAGFIVAVIGLTLIFATILTATRLINHVVNGMSTRILYRVTNINSFFAIIFGALPTLLLVPHASVSTSLWLPFAALDVIGLEQVFPLILGANLGDSAFILINSMAKNNSDNNNFGVKGLQLALIPLLLNIAGSIIWFPIKTIRRFPLHISTQLGLVAMQWQGFQILFLMVLFFVLPSFWLGISILFASSNSTMVLIGSCLVALFTLCIAIIFYCFQSAVIKNRLATYLQNQERCRKALQTFPDDFKQIQQAMASLIRYTKLPRKKPRQLEISRTGMFGSIVFGKIKKSLQQLPDEIDFISSEIHELIKLTKIPPSAWCHQENQFGLNTLVTNDGNKDQGKTTTKTSLSLQDFRDVVPLWYQISCAVSCMGLICGATLLILHQTRATISAGVLLLIFLLGYWLRIVLIRDELYKSWKSSKERQIMLCTLHEDLAILKFTLSHLREHCMNKYLNK